MSSCSGSTRTERCIRFGSKPTKLPFLNGVFGRNGPYARSKWRAGPAFPRSFLEDATTSGGHVGEAQSPHPDVAIACPSGLWMNRRQPETTQKRACRRSTANFLEADFWTNVKVRDQVSHPLRRDSGRGSNRNRHLSPSLNISRRIGTYRGSRDDSFGLHNQASFTPAVRMPVGVKAGRGGQRSFRRCPDHAP